MNVDGCFIHQAYSDSFFASQGFTSLIDASSLPSGSGVLLAKGLTAGPVTSSVTEATAAVVQANANGDTVANLRGLSPSDAPTIQDQIAMVVQFRTIQNPSISGVNLTTQLVNGLVNDGVIPPSQASTIISAVVQQLVTPAGVPSISGRVISESRSNGVAHAVVKLTNIGSGTATNTQITRLVLKTLAGTGTVTVNSASPGFPFAVPDLLSFA
jgi:hypothetical protein